MSVTHWNGEYGNIRGSYIGSSHLECLTSPEVWLPVRYFRGLSMPALKTRHPHIRGHLSDMNTTWSQLMASCPIPPFSLTCPGAVAGHPIRQKRPKQYKCSAYTNNHGNQVCMAPPPPPPPMTVPGGGTCRFAVQRDTSKMLAGGRGGGGGGSCSGGREGKRTQVPWTQAQPTFPSNMYPMLGTLHACQQHCTGILYCFIPPVSGMVDEI